MFTLHSLKMSNSTEPGSSNTNINNIEYDDFDLEPPNIVQQPSFVYDSDDDEFEEMDLEVPYHDARLIANSSS